jgi:endonuclease YncB( thermonuclease family)
LLGPGSKKIYLDAPEKKTVKGRAAIERVLEILTNPDWYRHIGVTHRFKTVKLFIPENHPVELMDINSFSRILGEIWVDGERLGDVLLREGHATLQPKK